MAKRRKSSKCPEPLNTLFDVAGAAAMGLYVKHKVKKDFGNGRGEESAKAAAMVFGTGAMRKGSQGTINLGGLIGLNSALKDIEQQQKSTFVYDQPYVSPLEPPTSATKKSVRSGLWREHCEDGSSYGLSPEDFVSADEYADAIQERKKMKSSAPFTPEQVSTRNEAQPQQGNKYCWRKHCEDGSKYGIDSENYETADDYEDALSEAKKQQ